jgi:hypothetical protein
LLTYPQQADIIFPYGLHSLLVDEDDKFAANMLARKRGIKVGKVENAGGLKGVKGTMKLPPFLSTFVLNKMCELIMSGVTKKGSKKVRLTNVAKKVFNYWKYRRCM